MFLDMKTESMSWKKTLKLKTSGKLFRGDSSSITLPFQIVISNIYHDTVTLFACYKGR